MRNEWHQAAIDGAVAAIERRLAEGQTIDRRDRYGQTALMLAATHGRAAVVDVLLAHGADPDATAKYGLSALMLAIVNRHAGIASALVAAGADTAMEGTGAPGFAGKNAGDLAREAGFAELADSVACDLIARAFAGRTPPAEMTDSKQLSDVEFDEVMSFDGMRWQAVTFDRIEANSDAVFWFAPAAFCYYLPGCLTAGLREGRWDANCYDALIGMLDRSPEPANWDDFFLPRWTLLTKPELRGVAAWIDWLESVAPDAFHDNSYARARETLALLAEKKG
jgi:hypothetical protein